MSGGRRFWPETGDLLYRFADFVLDTDRRELRRGPQLVAVAPQAFDLLEYLIKNRNRVVSRDDLITAIWDGRIVSETALSTRMNAVRCAIEDPAEEQRLVRTLPRKGVRFVGIVHEAQEPEALIAAGSTVERPRPALALPDRPSIAVLPFTNLSGDQQQDYFSDGITEDITTELSRFSELLVIARNSAFQYKGKAVDIRQVGRELGARYLLEGSVRCSGGRIRIAAQLIDAVTGSHRWAERYDRELHDAFAVQDEMAGTIVATLAAHVNRAETERALLKPPATWETYEYFLRGAEAFLFHQSRRTKASLYDARHLLEQSLALDPAYARAAAMLSWTYSHTYREPLDGDYLSPAALDRALELAQTAVLLDPHLPQARAALGHVLIWKRQHDAAIAEFERAFALNPNFIDYRFAAALMFAGEPSRALEVLQATMRLDPFQPTPAFCLMGCASYMLKRYGEAVGWLRESALRQLNQQWPHLWLAAAYAQAGQLEEARAEAAEVLQINPAFTIESWKRIVVFKDCKDLERYLDGLRKAGLPET